MTARPWTRATSPWRPSTHLHGTVDTAREVLVRAGNTVVLTGAGLSTDSGLPDYRGPDAPQATPMLYAEFIGDPAARQRYWARNYRGYAAAGDLEPNPGHEAIARWEHLSRPTPLVGLITQNVDGLHEQAGSRRLIPLHGRGRDVMCLRCGRITSRADLQAELAELNPGFPVDDPVSPAQMRPDYDAEVREWQGFRVPNCRVCGGLLKPDVTFFGEPVPKARVTAATAWCQAADAMLVAGSSLTVMSGLRFVRAMAKAGKPVVIVNHGATRADELATVRLDEPVSQVLQALIAD